MPTESETGADESGAVRSVVRSLRVLEYVLAAQPVRVGEVAPAVGLSKSTAQRVLRTLEEAGWIRPGPGSATWEVAPRIRRLFGAEPDEAGLREAALGIMRALRDETGETIHLTVPAGGGQVRILERVDTEHELRSVVPVGTVFDEREVAAGLALDATREAAGAIRGDGWVALPSPTGHSVGIAAAASGPHGPLAALVVVVPVGRHVAADDARLGAAAARAAMRLSERLGGV